MNIQKMLKQAQQMQARMEEAQQELAGMEVEGTSGGGKVKVVANGAAEILSIRIDPDVVDPRDVEMIEDLVLAAIKEATAKARELAQSKVGKLTSGLNLPGLSF